MEKKLESENVLVESLKKAGGVITNIVTSVGKVEENRRNVEIFKLVQDIKSPTFENVNRLTNTNVGDFVLILGNEVWVQDRNTHKKEQFVQASYVPEFVRANPIIFEKL